MSASFSVLQLIDAQLPMTTGKPIRQPDLPVMSVSGELERLCVVVVGDASLGRGPVLHRGSGNCGLLCQQQGPNQRTGSVRLQ